MHPCPKCGAKLEKVKKLWHCYACSRDFSSEQLGLAASPTPASDAKPPTPAGTPCVACGKPIAKPRDPALCANCGRSWCFAHRRKQPFEQWLATRNVTESSPDVTAAAPPPPRRPFAHAELTPDLLDVLILGLPYERKLEFITSLGRRRLLRAECGLPPMTERSIIFSRPMVRAILDGRKTQTRRVVKLPPAPHLGSWEPSTFGGPGLYLDKHCAKPANLPEQACISHTRTGRSLACPYGSPGDRLWVRETWARDEEDQEIFFYRASDHESCGQPWRPPIFMPRRAARITLEITEVRVQRVQEISPQDAKAEGIESRVYLEAPEYKLYGKELERLNQWTRDPRWSYEKLWDSINAKRGFSWASNPFVWAITFRYLRSSASIGGEFLEDVKAARA